MRHCHFIKATFDIAPPPWSRAPRFVTSDPSRCLPVTKVTRSSVTRSTSGLIYNVSPWKPRSSDSSPNCSITGTGGKCGGWGPQKVDPQNSKVSQICVYIGLHSLLICSSIPLVRIMFGRGEGGGGSQNSLTFSNLCLR